MEVMELALKAPTRRKRRAHHHAGIVRTGSPALVTHITSHHASPPTLSSSSHVMLSHPVAIMERPQRIHALPTAKNSAQTRPGHRSLLLLPSSRHRSRLLLPL